MFFFFLSFTTSDQIDSNDDTTKLPHDLSGENHAHRVCQAAGTYLMYIVLLLSTLGGHGRDMQLIASTD
jgi:hypothetical protein